MSTYAPARPTGRPVRDGLERLLGVLPAVPCPWRARRTEAPGVDLRLPVPHDPRQLGPLRREVRRALDRSAVPEHAADEAVLVVSELVTNAVTHGTSPAELRLVLGRESHGLRVEVTDSRGESVPALADPSRDLDGRRGLLLVAALTDRWGWYPSIDGPGKTVWAVLDPDLGLS